MTSYFQQGKAIMDKLHQPKNHAAFFFDKKCMPAYVPACLSPHPDTSRAAARSVSPPMRDVNFIFAVSFLMMRMNRNDKPASL